MILIADSGSTKTTWMDVDSGNKIVTEGLNPHFTCDEAFQNAIEMVRRHLCLRSDAVSQAGMPAYQEIIFYGAGCGNESQRQRVISLLQKGFATDNVQVETDMLGACRAVSGDKPSLVGILGTGSNACYYDGEKIHFQPFSSGYILGDHGSANHVGRFMLEYYLGGCLHPDVAALIHESFPMTNEQFIDAVYHQPNANRFLASLASVAVNNQDNFYFEAMIRRCLDCWEYFQLRDIREKSECKLLSVVGGYAARIPLILKEFAEDHHMMLGTVIADPIDGLRKYHQTHNTL